MSASISNYWATTNTRAVCSLHIVPRGNIAAEGQRSYRNKNDPKYNNLHTLMVFKLVVKIQYSKCANRVWLLNIKR